MTPTKNQIVIIGIVGLVVIIFLFMMLGIIPGIKSNNKDMRQSFTATLNMWGVENSKKDLEPIFSSFSSLYPNVQINYRQFPNFSEYNRSLLDALASGEGPDIFVIRNTDLPASMNKIYPAPIQLIPDGFIKRVFPYVVEQDFVQNKKTYALPATIDTLALFYNNDLFNQEAVAVPKSWDDFIKIIPKLTKFDKTQNIVTSGAAIGTSIKNIPEASDMLSLLMLQTGTQMVSRDFTSAMFNSKEGENALKFYTQFADNRSKLYTWNNKFSNNLDAFAEEKTAMIFSYSSSISKIQKRNSFLNFGISEIPQPKNNKKSISYANYYGFTVSKQSKYKNVAWELLAYTLTNQSVMKKYTDATRRPPALSNLDRKYKDDADIGVFARQALISKSWPQIDTDIVKDSFSKAIEAVNSNILTPKDALHRAKNRIDATMR